MLVLNKGKEDIYINPFMRGVRGCAGRGIKSCTAKRASTREESRMGRAE